MLHVPVLIATLQEKVHCCFKYHPTNQG